MIGVSRLTSDRLPQNRHLHKVVSVSASHCPLRSLAIALVWCAAVVGLQVRAAWLGRSGAAALLVADRARGDSAMVDQSVTEDYVLARREGETDEPERAWSATDRFRFREDVEAVLPGGVAQRVARRYDQASTYSAQEGAKPSTWKWTLPGHRFQVTRTGSVPTIDGPIRLGGSETRELEAALYDRARPLLPGRLCSVGQSWSMPDNAFLPLFTSSHTTGSCRLESVAPYRGRSCAHIVGRAVTTAVDHRGRRLVLQTKLDMLWSTELRRPMAFTSTSDAQVDTKTGYGGLIVTEHLVGRVVFHQTYTWISVGGISVARN